MVCLSLGMLLPNVKFTNLDLLGLLPQTPTDHNLTASSQCTDCEQFFPGFHCRRLEDGGAESFCISCHIRDTAARQYMARSHPISTTENDKFLEKTSASLTNGLLENWKATAKKQGGQLIVLGSY